MSNAKTRTDHGLALGAVVIAMAACSSKPAHPPPLGTWTEELALTLATSCGATPPVKEPGHGPGHSFLDFLEHRGLSRYTCDPRRIATVAILTADGKFWKYEAYADDEAGARRLLTALERARVRPDAIRALRDFVDAERERLDQAEGYDARWFGDSTLVAWQHTPETNRWWFSLEVARRPTPDGE